MKKLVCLLLVFSIGFVGCAGRESNPIPVYLPGDENRSCTALQAEMAQLQAEMAKLQPKTDKGMSNGLWAVAGVFFIIPFFFMDFKNGEKIEYDAMSKRYNRLMVYACEQSCDFGGYVAKGTVASASVENAKNDSSVLQSKKLIVGYQIENKGDKKYKVPVFDDGTLGEPYIMFFD